jgi:urease accessory protein
MRQVRKMSECGASVTRLLWLASPALPIGAYAYSRGLEQAAARGDVSDEVSLGAWIAGVLGHQVATLDAPVMLRARRAAADEDWAAVEHWSEFLCANRESAEFALEDAQLGGSLCRLLEGLGVASVARLGSLGARVGHAVAFGVACAHFSIAQEGAVAAYLFSFVENQLGAALKCLRLGQSAGQRVLARLIGEIDALVPEVLNRADEALGAFAPGLALVSALHETQYSRLFRS